ncbi:MAG: hypothetical protein HY581_01240 [Nitrospirae bacterium]|nr:hypothetical protein [Nitrospirota bacterium]
METQARKWARVLATDRCPRCGGLMVAEQCFDFWDDTGQLEFPAWRCVQCGELVDPIIVMNRCRPNGLGTNAGGATLLEVEERS